MKDTYTTISLFTRLKDAFSNEDYALASNLYIEVESKMAELRELYSSYSKNILDL